MFFGEGRKTSNLKTKMQSFDIYDQWNYDKKEIQRKKEIKFFINKREIWFTKMGKNIGFEENGKEDFLRPVLVIKKVGTNT